MHQIASPSVETQRPQHILSVIRSSPIGEFPEAVEIMRMLLESRTYDRRTAMALMRISRTTNGTPWAVRRLAMLVLQQHLLKLPRHNLDEHDYLFVRLGLKSRRGNHLKLKRHLLKEGFETLNLVPFISDWHRYLGRHNHLFRLIRGTRTESATLHEFLALTEDECKLSLARYLLKPEEVVDRILTKIQVSKGFAVPFADSYPAIESVIDKSRSFLPPYEAAILDRLCDSTKIYWVTERTPSRLNSLVEYPLGSVVLVVKPPGSCLEFELKRAGLKNGDRRLGIVYSREDSPVYHSHRLDGGSVMWHLQHEAAAASRLAAIFFAVHGKQAPICLSQNLSSIYTVPTDDGNKLILDYFTQAEAFGRDFSSMREAMEASVKAYFDDGLRGVAELPGHLGTSHNFLIQYWPAQAIQSGTTSFRLEILEDYLCRDGTKRYFEEVAGRPQSTFERLRLANQILQELLGCCRTPSGIRFRSFRSYVRATLDLNRTRADRTYSALLKYMGHFWGTMLAVRAYSNGESITMRNIGIKSGWEGGQWRVRLAFMDHDDLHIPPRRLKIRPTLRPLIPGMRRDRNQVIKSCRCLARIYRVSADMRQTAEAGLVGSAGRAYRKTLRSIASDGRFRRMFNPMTLDWLQEVDRLARTHNAAASSPNRLTSWDINARRRLRNLGWQPELIDDHIQTVREQHRYLLPGLD